MLSDVMYLQLSVGLTGHSMSSVAEEHQSTQVILNVGCPNHGEVILEHTCKNKERNIVIS